MRNRITWRAYPAIVQTKSNFVAQGQDDDIPRTLRYKTIGFLLQQGEIIIIFFKSSTREVSYEFNCVIIQI